MSLQELLKDSGANSIEDKYFAIYLDSLDLSLSTLRGSFSYPTAESLGLALACDPIYFCGNSLGLMPRSTKALVNEELDVWAGRAVLGHFDHPHQRPWKDIDNIVNAEMSHMVGANDGEVAVMGSLTSNLHLLLSTFYKPSSTRTKILLEEKAFPSDQYALESQVRLHGLAPSEALLVVSPRPGDFCIRTEDILETIERNGSEIALLMLSGVQYYTGQLFDIQEITKAGHKAGCVVGWDLAHAVGNVKLNLHKWEVDFAVWCNYKYVNGGPGAIGGLFVHQNANHPTPKNEDGYHNRLSGWWGHNPTTRFQMQRKFDPIPGAAGYQLSNPSVLNLISLYASLLIFEKTTMDALVRKSALLTTYLEELLSLPLSGSAEASYKIITPPAGQRGAQLSLLFEPRQAGVMEFVMKALLAEGIIADERQPDVIRLSPTPSYNTFVEVQIVSKSLKNAVTRWRRVQTSTCDNELI